MANETFIEKIRALFMPWKSARWVTWKAGVDLRTCDECRDLNGKVFSAQDEALQYLWPRHLYCRCTIEALNVLPAGSATQEGMQGADYSLIHNGRLPKKYLTKQDARALGWVDKKGNLGIVAKGKMIGGNIYYNRESRLPQGNGRVWYEADINYTSGHRGPARILYSNDGLVFVTYDHYQTFYEILKEGETYGK